MIDRRKEEYLSRVVQNLDKIKDIDQEPSNPQFRKERKELNEQRRRGVKAF